MAGVPYNPLMRASASQTERPKPNSIYEALQASARQATNDFNSSSFSQSMSNDVSAAANSIYAALMAPGDAMRGNLNSYEIDPNTGYTMNTGLMDAATNMAGVVQLGSLPMPRPSGSLGMGARMYHGSPDISWMDNGMAFSGANPVTAPSKYMFASPKSSVAETYAGTSEMALWKAENGLGRFPGPNAGVRKIELKDSANLLKIKDVNKIPEDLGVSWGGPDSLERLLDAAKKNGYDAVQLVQDGGTYAILNPESIKKVTRP